MVSLSPVAYALLGLVGFAAGVVDSIAGGGGLLTLPALMAAGLPPHLALATNKGQAVFGAVSSTAGYARRGAVDKSRAPLAFALGFVGSVLGAVAQLAVKPAVLRPVVIGLLVTSAIVVAWPRPAVHKEPLAHARVWGPVAALFFGAYDGFFGPGVGTMLLVSFVLVYAEPLWRASGNAKVVNLASNLAAFGLFAWRGNIVFAVALPMAAANVVGAWTGAHLAVRGGDKVIRGVVLAVVGALVVKLASDLRGE
ncbi:MAG TPA: TSUP family transporter [Polyangiaceae bacterium]